MYCFVTLFEAGDHARGFNGNHMYHPPANIQNFPDLFSYFLYPSKTYGQDKASVFTTRRSVLLIKMKELPTIMLKVCFFVLTSYFFFRFSLQNNRKDFINNPSVIRMQETCSSVLIAIRMNKQRKMQLDLAPRHKPSGAVSKIQ
jgi:hypothetical protein